jgi:MinD superfamily P-loop ATPase
MKQESESKRTVIAIASGKGGTGKTTVAVSLAMALRRLGHPVRLLDCDVEEPNCHIFMQPTVEETESVGIPVPVVDEARCNACGACGEICQYSAIVSLKTKPLVFAELCHGCGGCAKVCPTGAIREETRRIGVVEIGHSDGVGFVRGCLDVGHPMSPPLIRAVKKHIGSDGVTIIDCPPGTSCPVIAAIRDSDYVLLVTEPTPFGLHDLKLAVETVRKLELAFGVVINRADAGDGRTRQYCAEEGIRILLEIPDDRRIAEAYSRGQPAVEAVPEIRAALRTLHEEISSALEWARASENRVLIE